MKTVYTILDRAAQEAGPPFLAANDQVAKRYYDQILKENPYHEDFRLYRIGSFDQETMELMSFKSPEEVFYAGQAPVLNLAREALGVPQTLADKLSDVLPVHGSGGSL